jgi:beta-mannosidase
MMFYLFLLISLLLFPAPQPPPSPVQKIELKANWQFRQSGQERWYPAAVPGCLHTDLLANGLIDDPFFRDNEKRLRWIEEREWEYAAHFRVSKELLQRENLEIVFAGLDTYADVYLNGSLLFSAHNMFRQWRKGCRHLLKVGENTLAVHFHSPIKLAAPRWQKLGHELPGGPRVVTRKAAYHYGWDWGPRFVTAGIWRPVYLWAWDRVRLADLHIVQKSLGKKRAEMTAVFEILSTGPQTARLSISRQEGNRVLHAEEQLLATGKNRVSLDFVIPNPRRWWTRGLGEPYLYRLTGTVNIDNRAVDHRRVRIGLRSLELVQEEDRWGRSFYFRLNGEPVFMKGANYIPQDSFPSRVTPEQYRGLLKSAAAAHMNMLRVWGGGIYENDIFYDLCDELGILVWQDFMFACALYPGDADFRESVRAEAIDNVRRLRNHPCLALWCGNNEIDEAWHNWGWQQAYSPAERTKIWQDYEALFHEMLPAVVNQYDPGRFYWPSSPQFGRADKRSLSEGDSHYWGVWHDGEPFEVFNERVGRFMSEYGFQSLPPLLTVESFTLPQDRALDSPVMLAHQKHPRGNQLIQAYLERYYRTPGDFPSFLYVSQVLQAEGIKIAIEAHRRARPRCMGTLYWQLNDCWPVASWSGIDYFGRQKALHYYVEKAYRPLLVSPLVDRDRLKIYIISDLPEPFTTQLTSTLLDFSGESLWHQDSQVVIEGNSSRSYRQIPLPDLLKGRDKRRLVLAAVLLVKGQAVSQNLLYFVPPKELDLAVPRITYQLLPQPGGCAISLSTDRLARHVFLSVEGVEGFFSDNFFDLLPGRPVTVYFRTDHKNVCLAGKLKIKSLIDSYPKK